MGFQVIDEHPTMHSPLILSILIVLALGAQGRDDFDFGVYSCRILSDQDCHNFWRPAQSRNEARAGPKDIAGVHMHACKKVRCQKSLDRKVRPYLIAVSRPHLHSFSSPTLVSPERDSALPQIVQRLREQPTAERPHPVQRA